MAAGERGEQARAAVAGLAGRIVAAMDDPQFQAGMSLIRFSTRPRQPPSALACARSGSQNRRHDDGDIAQIVAVFLHAEVRQRRRAAASASRRHELPRARRQKLKASTRWR